MKGEFLMGGRILALLALLSVGSQVAQGSGEWQILTAQNFSSQIRLHPYILLFVTSPWSGESRSLMKEVADLVGERQKEFGSLKLMYIHSNTEKMLADAVGATEEITILFYHHAVSYKYRGKLRAQNVLSSAYHCMSLSSEELPFKSLNTLEDLKSFLDSTDKALLLLEFCGWTPTLLTKKKRNGTENGFGVQGDHTGPGFTEETNGMPLPFGKDKQKGWESEKLKCSMKNGFGGIPWIAEFRTTNETTPIEETERNAPKVQLSCTYKEFQRFDSFLSKFMTVARELFLPPEMLRFGLVSERSLLSFLGVEDSSPWLVMLYHAGCPTCSKILKEGDDLKAMIQGGKSIVIELVGDGQNLEPSFPVDKPSVLLIIDRSSDSSESRRNSKEALNQFRELALKYHNSYLMGGANNHKSEEFSDQAYKSSKIYGHPQLRLSRGKRQMNLKDKMSVMILNEGQQVTINNLASAVQGSSFHEILEHLLHQKKKTKLSSLAKDAGFQLLSDDFEIKVMSTLPSESEDYSGQVSDHQSEEETLLTSNDDLEGQLPHMETISSLQHKEKSELYSVSFVEHEVTSETGDTSSLDHKEKYENGTLSSVEHGKESETSLTFSLDDGKQSEINIISSVEHGEDPKLYIRSSVHHKESETIIASPVEHDEPKSEHVDEKISRKSENLIVDVHTSKSLLPSETGQYIPENQFDPSETVKMSENNILNIEISQQLPFADSFFFSEGNYRLLKALTGESKIPSLIVVDPFSQKHYVFPDGLNFNYSSMDLFLEKFLEGSLSPYQRSETIGQNPREGFRPPFVNLDFHEVDSVPRVTAHSLSQLVFDLNKTDSASGAHSWNDDVLVLFSMTWCGFCQRMELVVREVYRAIKGYANMLKSRSRFGEAVFTKDDSKEVLLKLPEIYSIDCTLNDCSLILNSIGQREVYPALILFPAQTKSAISYEGDITVAEIVKFIAANGTKSHHLVNENGVLWTVTGISGGAHQSHQIHRSAVPEGTSFEQFKLYELRLKSMAQERDQRRLINLAATRAFYESGHKVAPGSYLIATQKLLHVQPFENSVIIIVKAVQNSGFSGLIINKQIAWDMVNELAEAFQMLKEAPISFGGPIIGHALPLVALGRGLFKDLYPEVLPGIFYLDQVATTHEIESIKAGNRSVADYWFFLGYSSWGWEQLYNEIAEGAWELKARDFRKLEWPQI